MTGSRPAFGIYCCAGLIKRSMPGSIEPDPLIHHRHDERETQGDLGVNTNRCAGRHSRARYLTIVLLGALLFGLIGALAPVSVEAQDTSAAAPLDARIGGTIASFEVEYGATTNKPTDDVTAKRSYRHKDYQYLTAYAIDGYVYRLTFTSDRKKVDAKDRKTWSKSRATSIAKQFLPADAECGKAAPLKNKKVLRTTCSSAALTAIMFPADYQRVGRAGDPGSVSFMLTLNKAGGARVTAIEAIVGAMSEEEFAATQPTPAPTATVAVDSYNVSGPATESEKSYFRQAQVITLQLTGAISDVTDITSDPEFSTDPVLWFQLLDTLPPFHSIYSQWLTVAAPTARLEPFHQAMTDAIYNYDQMATNLDIGINNLDVSYIQLGTANMQAGTEAIGRALELMTAWEDETGFDISEDL